MTYTGPTGDATDASHPTAEALDDFLDGVLPAGERDAVSAHLAACAACDAEMRALRALLRRASALPRAVDPPPELWAAVQARLVPQAAGTTTGGRPRPAWTLAAAAVLLLIAGSTFATRAARSPLDGPGVAASPVASAAVVARAEAEYVRAAAELRAALDAQRAELSPAAVATVEQSLRVVDEAIVEARTALARDPENATIAAVLSANHVQKLDLLRRATRLLPPS
jgi:anti-sigma factor RsiW